ncbi:diphthine methyltransferase isoform X2 [Cephus cinctus]|nr:diphthine methyltransferase isoform X2 [Cephus cinctus]XP_024938622.1 diphthine methyltransferase isoform X2 [Cephus cinctus]XP_024938623.1 diphthine methyltransferase isoform X2 [Cephus cinctus]
MTSESFTTLDTFDTQFPADSVEWCPIEPYRNLFVCGTYHLAQEDLQTAATGEKVPERLGQIYLFQVIEKKLLRIMKKAHVAAVLDMKWAHVRLNGKILLGVVSADASIEIYQLLEEREPKLHLTSKSHLDGNIPGLLALSLDWSTGRCKSNDNTHASIVVSDSEGKFNILQLNETEELEKTISWNAHEFEAWIAAFDYWDTNIVYTGGDDSTFLRFDLRMSPKPVSINRSHHTGVTSLHCNSSKEFSLASGSYDETLRLWDTRNIARPLSELNLGGGIWRLKWDPFFKDYLLAACMYDGFKIINCQQSSNPVIIAQYMEHKNISYGCDWSFSTSEEFSPDSSKNLALIATCSFYDHILHLSTVSLTDD